MSASKPAGLGETTLELGARELLEQQGLKIKAKRNRRMVAVAFVRSQAW
ncbi:MAG: hypothetical protein M3511_03945 [Deinococcota bacterium]|nr:hypothetical protein [Deinococcota bacterium]